jgi:hypothetical protein
MPMRLALLVALGVVWFANLARGDFDCSPTVSNGQIVTNGYDDGTQVFDVGHRVFDYTLGADFPNFTMDPGFNALANNGLPGTGSNVQGQGANTSTLLFNVLSDLRYWNGSGGVSFGAVPSGEKLDWHLGPTPGGSDVIVGTGTGVQPGLAISTTASDGSLHVHLAATLQAGSNPNPADGIYLVEIQLHDTNTNPAFSIANSLPFWIIYNQNLDSGVGGPQDQAVDWVNANLVPEPATCVLAGIGGLFGLMVWRRKGRNAHTAAM